MRLLTSTSDRLGEAGATELRALLDAAFAPTDEDFDDSSWEHALGGVHFLLRDGDLLVAHASVVERVLEAGGRTLRTGYVEAVATLPGRQRAGLGRRVMEAVNRHVDAGFELGALSAAAPEFYARLGWQPWRGPTGVRTGAAVTPTPEDDGVVFVRLTPAAAALDLDAPLVCDWRPGEVW